METCNRLLPTTTMSSSISTSLSSETTTGKRKKINSFDESSTKTPKTTTNGFYCRRIDALSDLVEMDFHRQAFSFFPRLTTTATSSSSTDPNASYPPLLRCGGDGDGDTLGPSGRVGSSTSCKTPFLSQFPVLTSIREQQPAPPFITPIVPASTGSSNHDNSSTTTTTTPWDEECLAAFQRSLGGAEMLRKHPSSSSSSLHTEAKEQQQQQQPIYPSPSELSLSSMSSSSSSSLHDLLSVTSKQRGNDRGSSALLHAANQMAFSTSSPASPHHPRLFLPFSTTGSTGGAAAASTGRMSSLLS